MGRKHKNKKERTAKCPWCGREVVVHRDRYRGHLTPGGLVCIGTGMVVHEAR
jgi:hypothetical protein